MSDEEWRALTPRLLIARLDQQRENERTTNLRVGMIAAEIRNSLRTKSTDRVWNATDIFPDEDVPESTDDGPDLEGIRKMFLRMRPDLN